MSTHTLSVLVENKPGVLARIAGLFSRRGFNIDSLAVGPTEHPEVSRMTIVVNVDESPLEQVTKQLNKLVEVIKIVELDHAGSIDRELMLVKVRADATTRGAVLDAVQLFRAKVVDVAPDAVTIQVTGNSGKLADFLRCSSPSASASWCSRAWSPSAAAPARSASAASGPCRSPRPRPRLPPHPDHRHTTCAPPQPRRRATSG
jgi:acetolactate synthase-1/3 small subunit